MVYGKDVSCPLAFLCLHGWITERNNNGDGENGSDISRGRKKMEISRSLVCSEQDKDLRAMRASFLLKNAKKWSKSKCC